MSCSYPHNALLVVDGMYMYTEVRWDRGPKKGVRMGSLTVIDSRLFAPKTRSGSFGGEKNGRANGNESEIGI